MEPLFHNCPTNIPILWPFNLASENNIPETYIVIIQYKPTKCTFSQWIFFNFWYLLHVSNPRVRLQKDGCICGYGMVRFTCVGISGLVRRRVCSVFTLLPSSLGTAVAQWLRRCATNRKVAGSIPNGVNGIFHWHNPSDRTMALGSTQPLTEMSTRTISWG